MGVRIGGRRGARNAGLDAWSIVRGLLLSAALNGGIALFLTALLSSDLAVNMVVSQCIGLSIYGLHMAALHLWPERGATWWRYVLLLPLGGLLGTLLAFTLVDLSGRDALLEGHPRWPWIVVTTTLVFGSLVSLYFRSREHLLRSEAGLREAELQHAQYRQQLAETHLKLLQAQVEPHFLFNTLSTVVSLIDEAPERAKAMLEHFTHYLRVGLRRTRGGDSTLADELELLWAYLEIQAIRMGERLRYRIVVEPGLESLTIPPLLIQPLVENAVRHGLEPRIAGGSVEIRVAREARCLRIEVADTGSGMQGEWGSGVGLRNVRERLAALYPDRARLILRENAPSGVVATLLLPLGSGASAADAPTPAPTP